MSSSSDMQKLERLQSAVPLLLEWYRVSKRTLPWRGTHDFYKIWVSEIMLQQTRVEAVKDYYLRFLQKFPTVEALASADEGEVLKAWEGLGYYSRARNLHKAAKLIKEQGFPKTYEGIRALPGVGDYTAGAISSIAYELPCPAVDGNVLRILTRLLADDTNIDLSGAKEQFSALLKQVYPKEAGEFCQALMELGALVCTPSGPPQCLVCPWRELCLARLNGEIDRYPVRAPKRARKVEEHTVLVLRYQGEYALQKREKKGLLAGLWQFPFAEGEAETYGSVLQSKKAVHIFTHVEWHMTGFLVEAKEKPPQYTWKTAAEIAEKYALPSAFKAFKGWLT